MKPDKHENCNKTVVLDCRNCGQSTQFSTPEVEQARCPRCGHVPMASLHTSNAAPTVTPLRTYIKPMNAAHVRRSFERFKQTVRVA